MWRPYRRGQNIKSLEVPKPENMWSLERFLTEGWTKWYNHHHFLTQFELDLDLWDTVLAISSQWTLDDSTKEVWASCVHLSCHSFHTTGASNLWQKPYQSTILETQHASDIRLAFTSSWPMLSLPGVRFDWPTRAGIVVGWSWTMSSLISLFLSLAMLTYIFDRYQKHPWGEKRSPLYSPADGNDTTWARQTLRAHT